MNAYTSIEFESLGATLRGRLYESMSRPEGAVIIMAHGFTSTINNMTADIYAQRFNDAGFNVLLYDHRCLGISDGKPRQEINFWAQSRGYIDAIDHITSLREFENSEIAIWGASLSARETFLVGSVDDRISAIISIVPAFGEENPIKDPDGQFYQFTVDTVLNDDILEMSHPDSELQPVVSPDQMNAPSRLKELTAYKWFIEYGGRFGSNWKNMVSTASPDLPEGFHFGHCAPYLKAPIIFIIAKNDEMSGANPEIALAVFEEVQQRKQLIEVEGGHFGLLYYPGEEFEKSSKAQITFLKEVLDQKA